MAIGALVDVGSEAERFDLPGQLALCGDRYDLAQAGGLERRLSRGG